MALFVVAVYQGVNKVSMVVVIVGLVLVYQDVVLCKQLLLLVLLLQLVMYLLLYCFCFCCGEWRHFIVIASIDVAHCLNVKSCCC